MKLNTYHLGLYQIIGGIIGLVMIIPNLSNFISWPNILVLLLAIAFWGYSILCGVYCIKFKNNALRLSLFNQIFQIVGFAVLGYSLQYVSGVYLSIGIDLTESIEMTFGAGASKFGLMINQDNDRAVISINFVALGIIYWIEKWSIPGKSKIQIT